MSASKRFFFRELGSAREVVDHVTPNWFGIVMGTGIVAIAGATLPVEFEALRFVSTAIWMIAALLLVIVLVLTLAHWRAQPTVARSHASHPVMSQFYGTAPISFLTVAGGSYLLGGPILGHDTAVATAWVLWIIGAALGVVTAVWITYLMFTNIPIDEKSPFGGWVMPVVPPIVAAVVGATLSSTLPSVATQSAFLGLCVVLLGFGLFPTLVKIPLIWSRLAQHKIPAPALVPTLWLVLGAIAVSAAAVLNIAAHAAPVAGEELMRVIHLVALAVSALLMGFALFWLAVSLIITVKSLRQGAVFGLAWWALMFSIGNVVFATSLLDSSMGTVDFPAVHGVLYSALIVTWLFLAVRTFIGAVITGRLFAKPVQ